MFSFLANLFLRPQGLPINFKQRSNRHYQKSCVQYCVVVVHLILKVCSDSWLERAHAAQMHWNGDGSLLLYFHDTQPSKTLQACSANCFPVGIPKILRSINALFITTYVNCYNYFDWAVTRTLSHQITEKLKVNPRKTVATSSTKTIKSFKRYFCVAC